MTEEELKQAIRLLITYYDGEGDIVDGIVMLIKEAGYMTPEMVKGLIFEVQAKKCAQCPKNKDDYEWKCEMQHRKEMNERGRPLEKGKN